METACVEKNGTMKSRGGKKMEKENEAIEPIATICLSAAFMYGFNTLGR